MATPAPPAPPAPPSTKPPLPPAPPSAPNRNGNATTRTARKFGVSTGTVTGAHKIGLYGSGGVGKTELAALMGQCLAKPPLFFDLEDGTNFLDVKRVDPRPTTWEDLRDALHDADLLRDFGAVVIDSATKAEELATAWVVANVPHEKGKKISNIEDYGWGKGINHVYDAFISLLADLDAIARAGKHVVLICHECTANVPNPSGDDFLRFEPRLQSPNSGKASIRYRTKEWTDHLFYVGFDRFVNEDGKAIGSGSRTIYSQELPMWMAKSRSLADPIPYEKGSPELWRQLLKV